MYTNFHSFFFLNICRLARIKAEARKKREERERAEQKKKEEKLRRENSLKKQFIEWNVGVDGKVELALVG